MLPAFSAGGCSGNGRPTGKAPQARSSPLTFSCGLRKATEPRPSTAQDKKRATCHAHFGRLAPVAMIAPHSSAAAFLSGQRGPSPSGPFSAFRRFASGTAQGRWMSIAGSSSAAALRVRAARPESCLRLAGQDATGLEQGDHGVDAFAERLFVRGQREVLLARSIHPRLPHDLPHLTATCPFCPRIHPRPIRRQTSS